MTTAGTVVLEKGGRRETTYRSDEEALTAALAKLSRTRALSGRIVVGHRELSAADASPSGPAGSIGGAPV